MRLIYAAALLLASPLVLWAGALLGVRIAVLALVRVAWDIARE